MRNAEMLRFFINDIQDFSLLKNSKLRLNFNFFNLLTVIDDVFLLFKDVVE